MEVRARMSVSDHNLPRLRPSGESLQGGRRRPTRPARPLPLLFVAPGSRLAATYRRGLELAGYQVAHATSAATAVAAALARRPVLVVVDTELTDADETLWWLRSLLTDTRLGLTPVVLLTGGADQPRPGAAGMEVTARLPRATTSPYALAHWLEVWSTRQRSPGRGPGGRPAPDR
jgi:CheY-like chemotaxis protein